MSLPLSGIKCPLKLKAIEVPESMKRLGEDCFDFFFFYRFGKYRYLNLKLSCLVFETLYGIDVDVKQIRNMMFGFNPFWRPDSGIDTADLKILSNLSHHGSIGEFIF
jgi:hypothetical protein